jgi:hypothetical protein
VQFLSIAVLSAVLGANAYSASPSDDALRQQAVQKLMTSMRSDEMLQRLVRLCNEMIAANTPESIFESNPKFFHGITPQSSLWPKVLEIYKSYFMESCSYYNRGTILAPMEHTYSSGLSLQELTELNKFYSSPAGQKFIAVSLDANFFMQKETLVKMSEHTNKASENFYKKFADIVRQNEHLTQQNKKPWWRIW